MSDVYRHPEYLAFVRAMRESPDDDTPRLAVADWLQERGEEARAEFVRVQCEIARGPDGIDCRRVSSRLANDTILYDCYPELPAPPHPDVGSRAVARVFGTPQRSWSRFEGVCCAWVSATDGPGFTLTNAKGETWKPELAARERELLSRPLGPWPYPWMPVTSGTHNLESVLAPGGTDDVAVFERGFVSRVKATAADWLRHGDAILEQHPVRKCRITLLPFTVAQLLTAAVQKFGEDEGHALVMGNSAKRILDRLWHGVEFEFDAP